MASLRAVMVDLGGTILVPDPPVTRQYLRLAREILPAEQIPPADRIRARFTRAFHHMGPYRGLLRYGTHPPAGFWFWKRLIGMVFLRVSDSRLQRLTRGLYDRFARPEAWGIRDGFRRVARELRRRGCPPVLVSNWDSRARELLRRTGLREWFREVVISCEVGVEKPDPAIYRLALERVSCPAERALMVGDDLRNDLLPVHELGARTLWFGREEDPQREEVDGAAKDWGEVRCWLEQCGVGPSTSR